jgi:hypothetical protein
MASKPMTLFRSVLGSSIFHFMAVAFLCVCLLLRLTEAESSPKMAPKESQLKTMSHCPIEDGRFRAPPAALD